MRVLLMLLFLFLVPSTRDLDARVREILKRHKIEDGKIGIAVYSVKDKSIVYRLNDQKPLIPASNMKLVTTAAALDFLGADFKFPTRVYQDGEDLVVMAGGDPNISARDHDGDPTFLFKAWAAKVKGVNDVRLVNAMFDTEFIHPDWREYDLSEWYAAPVAAFSLNDNCIDITVSGGAKPSVTFVPKTSSIALKNLLTSGDKSAVAISRKGNEVTVRGEYPTKGTFTANCTVENPHQFFGSVLLETVGAKGKVIEVNEKVALAPPGEPLDTFTSTLTRTIEICNTNSQNFYAEMILKQLGYRIYGYGTFTSGAEAVTTYLKKLGIEDAIVRDGSGLSKQNRLSAEALVKVLTAMKDKKEYVDSLAISGKTGTLKRRLKELDVRAKTGHVRAVNTLSGYVVSSSKDTLIFSILVNDASATNAAIDDLCELFHGSF
jgi:D-alanyl-D-alanine carboxypeptidase/D-alanyl-D-alanine-endopeptidase (penicillin-binding protein 4)